MAPTIQFYWIEIYDLAMNDKTCIECSFILESPRDFFPKEIKFSAFGYIKFLSFEDTGQIFFFSL